MDNNLLVISGAITVKDDSGDILLAKKNLITSQGAELLAGLVTGSQQPPNYMYFWVTSSDRFDPEGEGPDFLLQKNIPGNYWWDETVYDFMESNLLIVPVGLSYSDGHEVTFQSVIPIGSLNLVFNSWEVPDDCVFVVGGLMHHVAPLEDGQDYSDSLTRSFSVIDLRDRALSRDPDKQLYFDWTLTLN